MTLAYDFPPPAKQSSNRESGGGVPLVEFKGCRSQTTTTVSPKNQATAGTLMRATWSGRCGDGRGPGRELV